MVAFRIEDVRTFTQKLFLGTDFELFLVKEAQVVTFNRFTIDGRIHSGFYSEEERELLGLEDFSGWKTLQPICFSLIKGKRLPESFRIDLMASGEMIDVFFQENQVGGISREQVRGLYLQIRYEEGKLYCITGTSLTVFTLDKTVEQDWDEYIGRFLKDRGIPAIRE